MASPNEGNERAPLDDPRNPYASRSRWRHQESPAFARHAAAQASHAEARDPVANQGTGDLANFLNKSRVEPEGDNAQGGHYQPITVAAGATIDGNEPSTADDDGRSGAQDGKEIVCGPLLNYRHMRDGHWFGSVLIVTKGGGSQPLYQPSLNLRRVGATNVNGGVVTDGTNGEADGNTITGNTFESTCLYSDFRNSFWAFDIQVPMENAEVQFEYVVPEMRYSTDYKPKINRFFVPALDESMRMMFHSCNGFSVGTDEDDWSGPCLWNDVMRKHEERPFHVMLGGGDQIYNDGIRVNGPLRAWTAIGNPKKRQAYPFPEKLRAECDDYYLKNYIRWYNTKPFAFANGQIPQVNIWDDHDIIDGFGSYTDHFMRCDVFRGIGGTAHKYYMLFQHHLPPPASTYTTDNAALDQSTQGRDPNQLMNVYVPPMKTYPPYILGAKPGPYVAERSYNMYTRLGARVALIGIDARTERTRHQVNYPETYDLVFERLRNELQAAASSPQPIKHLIVLLGIPIAYPRLTWLENVLRSPLIGPVKFFHKRFGVGGGLFNQFDGSVDLLDDLDDHYTARTHKPERAKLIQTLQKIAGQFSVRVTILGGDVHLAALGRFYSNPSLNIPVEEDNRYMANVVSSAIVNKPPPQAVANLLARRNKIHHLDRKTDETLLNFFDKDPGDADKTANHNHCTMPSRNFAMLSENSPNGAHGGIDGQTHGTEHEMTNGTANGGAQSFLGRDGHSELHQGEVGAGTAHKASSPEGHGKGHDGSLDIRINVEIDQHNPEGRTQAYGLTVPLLHYKEQPRTPATSVPPTSSGSAAPAA